MGHTRFTKHAAHSIPDSLTPPPLQLPGGSPPCPPLIGGTRHGGNRCLSLDNSRSSTTCCQEVLFPPRGCGYRT
eukprot:16176-Heterocapsa_arctica.AAC.1